jgi:hypothetical protein
MKGADKYLLGIVAAIALLVGATVIVVLLRPEAQYRADDSPEAVVHNYLLALNNGDYERAYACVSAEMPGHPRDLDDFIESVEDNRWTFGGWEDSAAEVLSSRIRGEKAYVEVQETSYSSGGLLEGRTYDHNFDMTLLKEKGEWKLLGGDRYWDSCWGEQQQSWCD